LEVSAETTAIELLDIFEKHVRAAVADAKAVLSVPHDWSFDDSAESPMTDDEVNAIADYLAVEGSVWEKTGEEEDGAITYKWPDGNLDTYEGYETFRCTQSVFKGVNLALAKVVGKGREMVGFVLGSGTGSRRPLTVFFEADDFDTTGERLSMIRGKGGGNSRKGYAPGEELPPAYKGFKIDVLGDRIKGKWNVQAVVVTDDEAGRKAMLDHTALQAKLRGIIS
jgi:hypothetical protein